MLPIVNVLMDIMMMVEVMIVKNVDWLVQIVSHFISAELAQKIDLGLLRVNVSVLRICLIDKRLGWLCVNLAKLLLLE